MFMWSMNYDDPDKLHMSLGLGMMVAACLLLMTSLLIAYDRVDDMSDDIFYQVLPLKSAETDSLDDETTRNYLEFLELKSVQSQSIITILNNTQLVGYGMMFFGFVIFGLGYIPYIKKHYKKRNN